MYKSCNLYLASVLLNHHDLISCVFRDSMFKVKAKAIEFCSEDLMTQP